MYLLTKKTGLEKKRFNSLSCTLFFDYQTSTDTTEDSLSRLQEQQAEESENNNQPTDHELKTMEGKSDHDDMSNEQQHESDEKVDEEQQGI